MADTPQRGPGAGLPAAVPARLHPGADTDVTMRKTLLTYVKPHVQEDPLSMILGIAYMGATLERAGVPIELLDERIGTDRDMKDAIDRNEVIGFSALTPNIRRAIAWAKYARPEWH